MVTCILATSHKDLDGVEIFAGKKELTRGCAKYGVTFATIEVEDDSDQDLLTELGLRKTISFICHCKEHGCVWLGVPCSSWVFIGRRNAGRYSWHPRGHSTSQYTARHNALAEIAINLALLAFSLGVYYVIEQPSSSVLWRWDPVVEMLRHTRPLKAFLELGNFGASSKKALILRGTAPWLAQLEAAGKRRQHRIEQPESLVVTTHSKHGIRRVTGKRKRVKASQAYPPDFGDTIGRLCRSALQPKRRIFSVTDD